MNDNRIQRALDHLDEEALLAFLVAFVRERSVYDPQDGATEAAAAQLVFDLLTAWGWSPLWEEVGPGRPNVSASLPGTLPGPTILLEGHSDVVTEGDRAEWTFDPFGAAIVDGRLYGRGSADMKAGVAAALFAVRAIQRSGVNFSGVIRLAVVADEEGLMTGIKDFVGRGHADDISAALVCEPEGGRVCIAQKGALRVAVTARGRMAHGAMPESGSNPIAAIAEFLSRVRWLERELQEELGEHPYLGKVYLTPTVVAGGSRPQLNVIPATSTACLDIRTTPDCDQQRLLARLRDTAGGVIQDGDGCTISLEVLDDRPATETDPEHPLVLAVIDAHRAQHGTPPQLGGVPGATDGTILWRDRGVPIVTYGPGDVTIPHQVDEFVRVQEVVDCARVYIRALLSLLPDTSQLD